MNKTNNPKSMAWILKILFLKRKKDPTAINMNGKKRNISASHTSMTIGKNLFTIHLVHPTWFQNFRKNIQFVKDNKDKANLMDIFVDRLILIKEMQRKKEMNLYVR